MNQWGLIGLAVLLLACYSHSAAGEIFTEIDGGFQGVVEGSVCWGDYDNDGHLDLFVCGEYAPYQMSGIIYRNDGSGGFVPAVSLPGITAGDAAWADYDNDGDLDLVITGLSGPGTALTMLYRNDGSGHFEPVTGVLPHVACGGVAWGDYDNDGDPDLLLAGYGASGRATHLLRNDGNDTFVEVPTPFFGMWLGDVSWIDYDGDGHLDVLISGDDSTGNPRTVLYRNEGNGTFIDSGIDLVDLRHSSIAWGDYDNDADLDLLIEGAYGDYNQILVTRLYRNDGGTLVETPSGLPNMCCGRVSWGDFDNDGLIDVLLEGRQVYRNEGGTFVQAGPQLNWEGGNAAWADYDNDGDLDFVMAGFPDVLLYRNDGGFPANTPPSAPLDLQSQQIGDEMHLSWGAAMDNETPSAGLSYNIRVGTQPGGIDIVAPMADPTTGRRLLPELGNAGPATQHMLTGLQPGVYYWSVQAVDGAYAGSPFAEEAMFVFHAADVPELESDTTFSIRQIALTDGHERRITLEFRLPEAAHAEAVLHDLTGRELMTAFSGQFEAGRHRTLFDPGSLAAGVYFCSMRSGGKSTACKVVQLGAGQR